MPDGVKFDGGKQRYDLVAPEGLAGLVAILTFGATKYADRNWEKGMAWGRLFGATMRHLWAWWKGDSIDPESGMSHLHHAACCIHFLQTYEARKIGTDDRPSVGPIKGGPEPFAITESSYLPISPAVGPLPKPIVDGYGRYVGYDSVPDSTGSITTGVIG